MAHEGLTANDKWPARQNVLICIPPPSQSRGHPLTPTTFLNFRHPPFFITGLASAVMLALVYLTDQKKRRIILILL